jgi:hypothetical protein
MRGEFSFMNTNFVLSMTVDRLFNFTSDDLRCGAVIATAHTVFFQNNGVTSNYLIVLWKTGVRLLTSPSVI